MDQLTTLAYRLNPSPKPKMHLKQEPNFHHNELESAPKLLRINIRHRGPTRTRQAQAISGVLWTTHDIPSTMTLAQLFRRHIKGGVVPDQTFILQQIDRRFEPVVGTRVFVWNELNMTKVADAGWVFDDGEVWLGSYIPNV